MLIQYRIINIGNNKLCPYVPQWRRKLTGFFRIFQFFFSWNNFPEFSIRGTIECRVSKSSERLAIQFIESIGTVNKYYKDLESKKLNKKFYMEREE